MEEKKVFLSALEIDSPQQRAEFLNQACNENPAFRRRIDALLHSYAQGEANLHNPDLPTISNDATPRDQEACDDGDGEISLDFLPPSDRPDSLGRLGLYEILEVIGRGGMGIVFRSLDTKLNRIVAIKTLAEKYSVSATARKRFLREAQAAATVSHPNVVTIHAIEEEHETPYLVMKCIEGKTLRDKVDEQGNLQVIKILRIGSQIAEGLAAAHAQGLIHRDVKPANILLENSIERVHITDFGLARTVDDFSISKTGEVAGTPEFMSPEQASGEMVDHRCDLFSLGSVLYTMCTGRTPFRADSTVAILRRVCDKTPRPIREVNPEVPVWLVEIIDKLLAKNPDDRFQTAREVAELLQLHLARRQNATDAVPPSVSSASPATKPRSLASTPAFFAMIFALVVAVASSAYFLNLFSLGRPTADTRSPGDAAHSSVSPDSSPDEVSNSTDVPNSAKFASQDSSATEILTADNWRWTLPVSLGPVVNSTDFESSPRLSADGLTLLFSSRRPGGQGSFDLWMTTRLSQRDPWATPTNLGPAINTEGMEIQSSLSVDELTLIFASSREGGQGRRDLWVSTRPTKQAEWSEPSNLGPPISSDRDDRDPCLSPDGLILHFASDRDGLSDLWVSRRSSVSDPWSQPVSLGMTINSRFQEKYPAISADDRTLLFTRWYHPQKSEIWMSTRSSPKAPWPSPVLLDHLGIARSSTLSSDGRSLIYASQGDLFMSRRGQIGGSSPSDFTMPPPSKIITSNDWAWTLPEKVDGEINTSYEEYEPTVAADHLTMIFHSNRPGGLGKHDLWMSRRSSTTEPWGEPTNLGSIVNSANDDQGPFLSHDGLTLLFSSIRQAGKVDLWMSTRESVESEWTEPVNLGAKVNSPNQDTEPCLSADGLSLIFASSREPKSGIFDLWMCTRSSTKAEWEEAVHMGDAINYLDWQGAPCLSADGLALLFHGSLAAKEGTWLSTRPTSSEPWSKAVLLSPSIGLSPSLTADGRSLYFRRIDEEVKSREHYDLWITRRVR